MKTLDFFFEACLTTDDAVVFAKSIALWEAASGKDKCWCLKRKKHSVLAGFSVNHKVHVTYKRQDARPLLLALSGRFYSEDRPVLVRRACCNSTYCVNPLHYYYGTRADVAMENKARKPTADQGRNQITPAVVEGMRQEYDAGESILRLSRKYKLKYHVARRICSENTYSNYNGIFSDKYIERLWGRITENCLEICKMSPNASRSFNFAYHVSEHLTCPWHRKGSASHKGNFGLMGECLDCMAEVRNGRCTVDVTQFDMAWYWQVKRFWEQVEIGKEDQCWPWLGTTRRGNSESIAYFPSPFHSSKTQSAPRVAFWLARGYSGKYRVFSKPDCKSFCCNPKHLTIREFKDLLPPAKIEKIQLNHGNIFENYRKTLQQDQSSAADKLPSA